MEETTARWIKQAEHDFSNAQQTFDIELYDLCLISCQQAVEKIIKALYIKMKATEPPRIHSLRKLVELVGIADDLTDKVVDLDGYYLALRYPDVTERMPYESCTKYDAEKGLQKTWEIIQLVKNKIYQQETDEQSNIR